MTAPSHYLSYCCLRPFTIWHHSVLTPLIGKMFPADLFTQFLWLSIIWNKFSLTKWHYSKWWSRWSCGSNKNTVRFLAKLCIINLWLDFKLQQNTYCQCDDYFTVLDWSMLSKCEKIEMDNDVLFFHFQVSQMVLLWETKCKYLHIWCIDILYPQMSNINCTSAGKFIVDHSDVVEASSVRAASTTSSFST